MIGLSREYKSIFGAPVIHAVDERVFTLRYFAKCLSCDFCHDACCNHGVDIDWANMEALRSLGPEFERFVGVPHEQWFTGAVARDPEFPSGAHVRTQTRDGKCVFADRSARGCRIHAFCHEHGLDYHLYKPLVSILFPLTFEYGALVPSSEALDASLVCGGTGESLYAGVRDELAYYFGDSFTAELDALFHSGASVKSQA